MVNPTIHAFVLLVLLVLAAVAVVPSYQLAIKCGRKLWGWALSVVFIFLLLFGVVELPSSDDSR